MLKPGVRPAVNVDDPYGRRLAAELPDALTFGEGGDVAAHGVELSTARRPRRCWRRRAGELPFASPLLGRYNLSNLLAAAAAAETLSLPHAAVAAAFAAQRPVPGRMEPVDRGQPFPVFVDYAHTDAALDAALRSAREMVGGREGGGGLRLRRRPRRRQAAADGEGGRRAGRPRRSPPRTTRAARTRWPSWPPSRRACKASGNRSYRLVPDRREAIREAIAAAGPGWAVVVAGKGHEREQIIGNEKLPFSDLEEIGKALEERFGAAVGR